MLNHLNDFFSGNFMSHGHCYLWKPELVWLHAGSDFLIALSYYSIPLLLVYFVRRRHDVPFQGIFFLFSTFILSCGTTHLLEIWTLWHPYYWVTGFMKAVTAIASLYTASELVSLLPQALALPSPAQLEAANYALEKEIVEHRQTVAALKQSQQRLSLLVQQTPMAVIEWNLDCEVSEWNPAAETMFGYKKSEAIGQHATTLMVPGCDKEQFNKIWQDLLSCQSGSCNSNQHYTPDDRSLFCEWYNIPLMEPNGSCVGVASLVQDITKRKEAEDVLRRANEELEQRVEKRTNELFQANEVLQAEMIERQLAESALWESEARLHTVVTKAPIILYATDSNGKLKLLEGRGLERLGHQPGRFLRESDFDLYRDQLKILENLPDVLQSSDRSWIVNVGDSVYENRATPVRDKNDQVTELIGVATDITQRQQAESTLAERERYLAALVEVQHRLLSLKGEENYYSLILELLGQAANASHVYVFENSRDANEQLLLSKRGQWKTTTLSSKPETHSPQNLPYNECVPRWAKVLAKGKTIMGRVSEFPDQERVVLERIGLLSLLVLPLTVNEQFFGFIVFGNCEEARVWTASEVDLLRAAAAALSLQHERSKAEVALRQSEAQLREQATQLEQTLHQLKKAQAQLVQSEKMSSLGLMVAGIAHEINNPVCFVYGNLTPASEYIQELLDLVDLYRQHYPVPVPAISEYTQEIDLDFLMEDLPDLLESMKVGAERIRDIVASLRTFSRLDEAKMKRVNIHEGLDSTLLILQHRLREKPGHPKIQVIKKYATLPLIECYAGQLNQVFTNILANAIDALESHTVSSEQVESEILSPPSSPCIQICTEIVDSLESHQDSKNVVIRIRDNGPGMTESVRLRLFDPFFTTKPVGQGTGLGLSISYQIVVAEHRGELRCVSAPGQGTEFCIQIPIQQPSVKSSTNSSVVPDSQMFLTKERRFL
ncbi:MAG: PAS domain S-box protein [Symplocastrum torsivum CPER-KK1]|jgi:PAS domain S-box-containing protein|uniref:histidine kinase n=1 Tax=Symplocastrum torsivum CPER-KK1 TaxID=450513 RepID=A0A951PH84_9CYAN|nr:PAS domain S-box protein [Symplocastrum torsivum CPER-KK1]